MGRLVTLEELEAYRQEIHHANQEGRVPKYRDPREVFNENPNREEGFLVEFTADELKALEEDRQRAYQDQEEMKAQVIQEIQENGNVLHADTNLPNTASVDERSDASHPELTEEQATALYDASQGNGNDIPPVGALENPAHSPSIAPEESVVPTPGTIEGAPEPMQSIVEAASLQGHANPDVHQNLMATPNPEPTAKDEEVNEVPDLELPDLTEPSSIPSPTAPADIAGQTQEQQEGDITDKITDPGLQQFQPVPGENAGPTVPGAETIQTPTLNDEAAVPSEPTNADAVNLVETPGENTHDGTNEPGSRETGEVNTENQASTSE